MKTSEKFSMKVTDYVNARLPDKTEEDLEIIRYGLEVLFMNFTKLPIILGIGYLLGVFSYTFYTLIMFGLIRMFAGGIHAKKSYNCLLSMLVMIFGSIYLSLNYRTSGLMKVIIFLVTICIYFRYAPADTEEKPYLDSLIRKQLKIKSMVTAIIYFFISITIKDMFFSNMFIHVLWIEGIVILPITYKLLKRRYNNYEHYSENI
ncbi:MAG: accessory gene regulator B [Clostridium sp.]|jgi:accessory gene regulator B